MTGHFGSANDATTCMPVAAVLVSLLPARRGSIHKRNLPRGSLDIKFQPDITKQCAPLRRNRARSQCCSPHTSLMAICGHYGPPMSHTHSPEWSPGSSRARHCGFIDSKTTAVFVVPYSDCCYWCLSSRSTPSNTSDWSTSMPTLMKGVVYLPVRWVRSAYAYMQPHRCNMHRLMENPLVLFFFHAVYILFILVQSPYPLLRIFSIQLLRFLSFWIHWHISQRPGPAVD